MSTIAIYHSVLGVRPGIHAAAELFRGAGYLVRVVDQYEGRVFDDYEKAGAFAASLGYPLLMKRATGAVADVDGPLVVAGFSNGAGMAEFVAASRGGVAGSLQFSGALPLGEFGIGEWPSGTAVQLHYAADDPFRDDDWVTPFIEQVTTSGASLETFLDYPTAGHLFTDESLPDEYDKNCADVAFERALAFLDRVAPVE